MKIEEFLKFDTAKLHRELTNILLIATEESNYIIVIADKRINVHYVNYVHFYLQQKNKKLMVYRQKNFYKNFITLERSLRNFLK